MNVQFGHPWAFALLPFALLPLIVRGAAISHPWLALLPRDLLSEALAWALRLAGAAAIIGGAAGLAEPYRAEVAIERIGQGAHVVLLLDRSRSMDQGFGAGQGAHVLDGGRRESKNGVARRLLAEFAAGRKQDLFGMLVFSTFPLPILDFTQKQDVIQAAIEAGGIGRGLSDTDVGRGLAAALAYFKDLPYTGSRVILLVSDGGAQLDPETRQQIRGLMQRYRVGLYWIYIRSFRSPGLLQEQTMVAESAAVDTVPEQSLHRFFLGMGTPYRAYEAENPQALRRAIDDVGRLENFPIAISDVLPRRDFSGFCYAAALAFAAVLLAARFFELRRWV